RQAQSLRPPAFDPSHPDQKVTRHPLLGLPSSVVSFALLSILVNSGSKMKNLLEVALALKGNDSKADQLNRQNKSRKAYHECVRELAIGRPDRRGGPIEKPLIVRQLLILLQEMDEHPNDHIKRESEKPDAWYKEQNHRPK